MNVSKLYYTPRVARARLLRAISMWRPGKGPFLVWSPAKWHRGSIVDNWYLRAQEVWTRQDESRWVALVQMGEAGKTPRVNCSAQQGKGLRRFSKYERGEHNSP